MSDMIEMKTLTINGETFEVVDETARNTCSNLSEEKVDKQDGYSMVSDDEKQSWNNKSNFSGNYNDLDNIPNTLSGYGITDGVTESAMKNYAQPIGNYALKGETCSVQIITWESGD